MAKINFDAIDELREKGKSKGWRVKESGSLTHDDGTEFASIDEAESHLLELRSLAQAERRFKERWIDPSVDIVGNYVKAAEALLEFLPANQNEVDIGDRVQIHLDTNDGDLGNSLSWYDFTELVTNLSTSTGQVSLLDRKIKAYYES